MIAEHFLVAAPARGRAAGHLLPGVRARVRVVGTGHRPRAAVPVREASGSWARFWDDRQAIGLKVLLLAGCLLAAGLLEVPW